MQKSLADKFLTALSVAYITIPVAIFFLGYLNYSSAIPAFCVLSYFALKIYQELSQETINLFKTENKKFWLVMLAFMLLWVFLSGIGGFMYQNVDFDGRNSIYRDMCTYQWPIIYDLSQQSTAVKILTGTDTVAFSYYFTYWFPPALISKIFSFNEAGRNICLYFYTVLGVFLIAYNLCRYFKRISYIIPAVFIFFSGMDIIGYVIRQTYLSLESGGGVTKFFAEFSGVIWNGIFSI